jgi:flagellar protein FlgJ
MIGFKPSLLESAQDARGFDAHQPLFIFLKRVFMSGIKIQSHIPVQQATDAQKQLREAATNYERHFLNEMVKAMRSTVKPTQDPSMTERIFTSDLYDKYTEDWSQQGGIGLADIIYNQLQERFASKMVIPAPQGPVPLNKGTTIKIDETQPAGIPMTPIENKAQKDMSYLFEWKNELNGKQKEVFSPWDAKVLQAFKSDDQRHTIKLGHDNGLVSTLSFLGSAKELNPGEAISAGTALGRVSLDASALNWQIVQRETSA